MVCSLENLKIGDQVVFRCGARGTVNFRSSLDRDVLDITVKEFKDMNGPKIFCVWKNTGEQSRGTKNMFDIVNVIQKDSIDGIF